MSLIAVLNGVIERPDVAVVMHPQLAREILLEIEYFPIAVGALKTLIKHPGHPEAKAHAERVIAHFDKVSKKAAPEPDLSDLG